MPITQHQIPTAQDVLSKYKHLTDAQKATTFANIIELLYKHEADLIAENVRLCAIINAELLKQRINNQKGGKNERKRYSRKQAA